MAAASPAPTGRERRRRHIQRPHTREPCEQPPHCHPSHPTRHGNATRSTDRAFNSHPKPLHSVSKNATARMTINRLPITPVKAKSLRAKGRCRRSSKCSCPALDILLRAFCNCRGSSHFPHSTVVTPSTINRTSLNTSEAEVCRTAGRECDFRRRPRWRRSIIYATRGTHGQTVPLYARRGCLQTKAVGAASGTGVSAFDPRPASVELVRLGATVQQRKQLDFGRRRRSLARRLTA